jgi:excisionase family DNA binding protein
MSTCITEYDREYYTVSDFAQVAGIHYNTVRRAIDKGVVQAINIGTGKKKIWRIHKSEFHRIALFDLKKIFKCESNEVSCV